jgi:hypothetical protein
MGHAAAGIEDLQRYLLVDLQEHRSRISAPAAHLVRPVEVGGLRPKAKAVLRQEGVVSKAAQDIKILLV